MVSLATSTVRTSESLDLACWHGLNQVCFRNYQETVIKKPDPFPEEAEAHVNIPLV